MTASTRNKSRLEGFGPLVLAGAGKMGGALLEGWLGLGLDAHNVAVLEPHPSPAVMALADKGISLNPSAGGIENLAAAIIAVKPQVAPEALPAVRSLLAAETVAISIMAGRTLDFLEKNLGEAAIVRAMPNTPAAIGRGITVAVANKRVNAAQRALAHKLLAASGAVEWVEDEKLLDAVTAVSGSGPAYVFLLAETLARAGVAAGLPESLAAKLARETVAGSGELLHRSSESAETLRKNVTSPGGTTAAALEILMSAEGLAVLMVKAVAAATKRSRELAG